MDAGQIADGFGVNAQCRDQPKNHQDGGQAAGYSLGEFGQEGDDGHGHQNEGAKDSEVCARQPVPFIGLELGDLAAANDDGESIDKTKDDRLRHQRISFPSFMNPAAPWMRPARMTVAKMYSGP